MVINSDYSYICTGGVGLILRNNNNEIIKISFFDKLFYNNILYAEKLKNITNIVKLKKYEILTVNFDNLKEILDSYCKDKLYEQYLERKDKIKIINNEIKIYFLYYDEKTSNLYYYLSKLKKLNKKDEYKQLLKYSIFWSLETINALKENKIKHDDFKLDNILIEIKKEQKETIDYFNNKKRYLINKTNYNLYLNDFDFTYEIENEETDFNYFKEKLFQHLDEDNNYNNKIKSIFKNLNNINDVNQKILNINSSNYKEINKSNLIKNFLLNKVK